jgi:hypothetical protein
MKEFYFYSERPVHKIIEEAFIDFKIYTVSKEIIKKNNLVNKNILLILNENLPFELNDSFLSKNNIVIFFLKQNKQDKKKYLKAKVFSEHTNINKFIDEVTTFYVYKPFVYRDIIIQEEKIINSKDEKSVFLTSLEKDILILLFEKVKIEKKVLLENVLKLKKDTETKTIESHLTRIRKKLISINSQVEIVSKENMVFLVA